MTANRRAMLAAAPFGVGMLVLMSGCILDFNEPKRSSGGGGGGPGSSGAGCPANAPAAESRCMSPGLTCEYGDDPRPGCRLVFACDAGAWKLSSGCACAAPPKCLAQSATQDQNCPSRGAICVRDDLGVCACDGEAWRCSPPPSGCPGTAPRIGLPCTSADQQCSYGDCAYGTHIERRCVGGFWEAVDGGCTDAQVMCL